jgi:hypothetical protein
MKEEVEAKVAARVDEETAKMALNVEEMKEEVEGQIEEKLKAKLEEARVEVEARVREELEAEARGNAMQRASFLNAAMMDAMMDLPPMEGARSAEGAREEC